MKKRLIYFIFFVILCFVINPCNYKAYQLDCTYKIDTNENGKTHYIWLHFERKNLSDEWKIRYNEKNQYDAWYEIKGVNNNPMSLKDYEITGITPLDTVCPSVAEFDMDEKKITLSNDIYILNTQKRVDKDPVHYECDYQSSAEGFRKTYSIHFNNVNGIYKFSEIYKWDSKTNKTSGVDRKVDTEGLIYIKREDNDKPLFEDLACPAIAFDDGNTVKLQSYELYNLNSTEYKDNNLVCNYYRKTDVNTYKYEIKFQTNGAAVWHTQVTNGQPAVSKYIGLYSNFEKKDECPITLKVKDNKISFPNVSYFYSTLSTQASHCMEITNENLCEAGTGNYSCVWVKNESLPNGGYCNINQLQFVACNNGVYDIPAFVPGFTSLLVNLLKIAAPIILIITSIISLLKALAASNEDEIKKAQKSLIRKMIASAMVFFVISIVQFVIMKVADDGESGNIDDCLTCLLNNDCNTTTYYKADVYGESICRYLSGDVFKCPGTETNNNVPTGPNENGEVDMIN